MVTRDSKKSFQGHPDLIKQIMKLGRVIQTEAAKIIKTLPKIQTELLRLGIFRSLSPNSPRFSKVAGIDGSSNDKYIELTNKTIFAYNAVAVLEYESPLKPPKPILPKQRIKQVSRRDITDEYVRILRDRTEFEMIIEASRYKPGIVFVDGSILSISLWHARMLAMGNNPYNSMGRRQQLVREIFEKDFSVQDKNSVFNRVFNLMKEMPIVFIPKAPTSQAILNNYILPNVLQKLPENYSDVSILSQILTPGQYLKPFPYNITLSGKVTTYRARDYAKDLVAVYFQAGPKGFQTIKAEFHKNHLPCLERILATIYQTFSLQGLQPIVLVNAHKLAKKHLPNLSDVVRLAQIGAINECKNELEKNQVYQSFKLAKPSKSYFFNKI